MNTLCQFAAKLETVPATTAWNLADLGEARSESGYYPARSRQPPEVQTGRVFSARAGGDLAEKG